MTETVYLNIGFLLWGVVLGLFYFGGLWFTIKLLTTIKHQALWMLASLLARNLLVAVGLYPLVLQGWQAALYCLAGFIMIRFILTSRIKAHLNG